MFFIVFAVWNTLRFFRGKSPELAPAAQMAPATPQGSPVAPHPPKPEQDDIGGLVLKGYWRIGPAAPVALLQDKTGFRVYDENPVNDRGAFSSVAVKGKVVRFGDVHQEKEMIR